ncbi:pseudouridine synthase [Leptolyngbya sp. 'hensonii']|nr:pseudouridine synthase [Leptolyngbya sp. 'hensonii']OLP18641.1 pseudouridine synthase [Leptolyngbya sp. 'hensonii']
MTERLQKIISQWGLASRREAEQLILAGRVRLNDEIAQIGQRANPNLDRIEVDGMQVNPAQRPCLTYLLLHKPLGIVSTCEDPQGRPTVLDLLPPDLQQHQGIHPVGRLDIDSTGALLLTNDGNLTFMLTHPRHHCPKTYQVLVQGHPPETTLNRWRQGLFLDTKKTRPAEIKVLQHNSHQTLLEIILREGRNRQIRRVAELLGHPVLSLHRVAIGPIHLGQLPVGQVRSLSSDDYHCLKAQVSIPPNGHHAKR